MVKTRRIVRNISINTPLTRDVVTRDSGVLLSVVRTKSGPGKSPYTTAAAAIPPRICDAMTSTPLTQPTAPIRQSPSVTLPVSYIAFSFQIRFECSQPD
jgi:hypothetical protein